MLDKARGLPADQVFLDLEDAVAPIAKPDARKNIVAALNEGGWGARSAVVRVNDWTTQWTYARRHRGRRGRRREPGLHHAAQGADRRAGGRARPAADPAREGACGYEVGRIGIEAQIENALGLINVDAIATATPRVETIIFGPADFMASINMKSLVVGEQPPGYDVGDAYHYILMQILMAARAHGKQAIDGPYLQIRDVDGLPPGRRPVRGARLRRQVGPAPGPDRRRQRGLQPAPGATTTTPRTSSTPTTTSPPRPAAPRCGDARRRDDRRGVAQDGAGRLGQGPRRRAGSAASAGRLRT